MPVHTGQLLNTVFIHSFFSGRPQEITLTVWVESIVNIDVSAMVTTTY